MQTRLFQFDAVYPPECTQQAVFPAVRPFVQSAVDGHRCAFPLVRPMLSAVFDRYVFLSLFFCCFAACCLSVCLSVVCCSCTSAYNVCSCASSQRCPCSCASVCYISAPLSLLLRLCIPYLSTAVLALAPLYTISQHRCPCVRPCRVGEDLHHVRTGVARHRWGAD